MTEIISLIKCIEALEQLEKAEKKEKKKRKYWVNPFLIKRIKYDSIHNVLDDLLYSETEYNNFGRLSHDKFEELLSLVDPIIRKEDTSFRHSIPSKVRLAVTLRFIASGDSYRSLEYLSRISRKTISKFVPEVLTAIYDVLQPNYMKIPNTENEWREIATDFNNIWNFPHVLGALDGKHIRIIAPAHSGSAFYNYKGFFSIVLFALVDAHGFFRYINVGANGKTSDSSIFESSFINRRLESGDLNIPKPEELSKRLGEIPYFFIGDDAFPLNKNLMKPFNRNIKLSIKQEIYNYRMCRARMIVEMAFGRLSNRFRIFHRPIEVLPETCDVVVKACCVLHNYLTQKRTKPADPDEVVQETISPHITPIAPQRANAYKLGKNIQTKLSDYLVKEGNVSFQWNKINRKQPI